MLKGRNECAREERSRDAVVESRWSVERGGRRAARKGGCILMEVPTGSGRSVKGERKVHGTSNSISSARP